LLLRAALQPLQAASTVETTVAVAQKTQ